MGNLGLPTCVAGSRIENTAIYQSVKAPAKWTLDTTLSRKFIVEQPPIYVIEAGTLYLLVQRSWANGTAMEVRFEEWTIEKLQNLVITENLTHYLPNKNEKNGGISWIPTM